jgi:hypothetical protein
MINWEHQGLIFDHKKYKSVWSNTHAQVPTAVVFHDKIRIYYATRDTSQQSLTSFLEIDPKFPQEISYIHTKPVIELGNPGMFDENGVMVGSVVQHKDQLFMYYTGWKKTTTVSYLLNIGLAISNDQGKTFQRKFQSPILGVNKYDPLMTMSPFVSIDNQGWHMWYGSGIQWKLIKHKYEPIYVIKYAHSENGLVWDTSENHLLNRIYEDESNVRPSIIRTHEGYEMYFCHRGTHDYRSGHDSYRIGKAVSTDGKNWERKTDFENFNQATPSYAAKMLAYPSIVKFNETFYCFVNGDGFGKNGFGLLTGRSDV